MAGLTLDIAEAKLQSWLAIDTQLQNGQTIKFNDRLFTRTDAAEVRNNIDYWDKKCSELSSSSRQNGGYGRSRTLTTNW